MERWVRFSGIVGLILLAFGVLGVLLGFTPGRSVLSDPMLIIHLSTGVVLIGFWAITVGLKNMSEASGVMKGRSTRFGANVLLYTTVIIGLLLVLNWFAYRNNKRWDLTEQGVYSLAPQTKEVLQKLTKPLKIVALRSPQDDPREVQDLLDRYRNENPSKIFTSVIDPRVKINLVEQYGMKPGNVIYLEYGEGENNGVSRLNESSEEIITNGILKLARGDAKKIFYVTGHEEPDVKGSARDGLQQFAEAISDEHLTMEPIILSTSASIPSEAAAVILVSPKKELLAEEKELLVKYVEQGGRLILFHDPRQTGDLREIAGKFGIQIGDDIVIDQIQRLFAAPALGAQPIVQEYGVHPITQGMTRESITIFNVASSVSASEANVEGVTYTDILKTSPSSWAEKNLDAIFESDEPAAIKEPTDTAGPVSLAGAWEKKVKPTGEAGSQSEEGKVSRVVVFGDSDFIRNANLGYYANRDLVLNAINWVAGEEGGVSIRPRTMRQSQAQITADMFWTMVRSSLILPELLLILGFYIWWRRRAVFA